MAPVLFPATLLWCFLACVHSHFIMDNNANVRIVSLSSPDCSEGRVEFFNGSVWGTFSDCTKSFQTANALSICNSLGFELETKYWRGTDNYNKHLSFNPIIAYTQLTNCSALSSSNTCSDCAFTHDLSTCGTHAQAHEQYDIFIACKNYGFSTQSTQYNCTEYEEYMDRYGIKKAQYSACVSDVEMQNKTDKKLIITLLTIAIFGSICCVISFALHSKHQDNKRLAKQTTQSQSKPAKQTTYQWPELYDPNRSSASGHGFATVPHAVQSVQLGAITKKNNDDYIPPPQPMFVYQTRQTTDEDEMDTNALYDMDEDNQGSAGYDMEEIIPNVIFSKNRSASESYGLIKTQDDDEDDSDDDGLPVDDESNE
eukprot:1024657_1